MLRSGAQNYFQPALERKQLFLGRNGPRPEPFAQNSTGLQSSAACAHCRPWAHLTGRLGSLLGGRLGGELPPPTDNVVRQGMRCCSTRGQRPNAPRLMVARWGFVVCCVAQAPRVSCACARRTVQQTADRCAMKRRAASPPRCVAASSVRPSVCPFVHPSVHPSLPPSLFPSPSVPRSLPPSVHPSVRPSVAYSLDRLLPPPSLGRTTRLMR